MAPCTFVSRLIFLGNPDGALPDGEEGGGMRGADR